MEAALKFAQSRLSPPDLGFMPLKLPWMSHFCYLKEVTATTLKENTLVQALQQVPGINVSMPRCVLLLGTTPVEDTDEFAKWLLTSTAKTEKQLW